MLLLFSKVFIIIVCFLFFIIIGIVCKVRYFVGFGVFVVVMVVVKECLGCMFCFFFVLELSELFLLVFMFKGRFFFGFIICDLLIFLLFIN